MELVDRKAKPDVLSGMAAGAVRLEMSSLCALHRWHVLVMVVTLQWIVAGGVTIHAARMGKARDPPAQTLRVLRG